MEKNKISLGAAIVIGMNAMIGAGVVSMPAMLSGKVGPAGIISYLIAVGLALLIGLSLSHLAEVHPENGWSYVYPAKWGGHRLGMFSAASYLGGVVVAMGFLVQQAGVWSQNFFPNTDYRILGASILIILTLLVLAGAEASSVGQYVIASCVAIPLLTMAIICWMNFKPQLAQNFMPHGFGPVLSAAPTAMFTLLGFESIASLYSIVINPKKNVPRATVLAILVVGSLYIFVAASVLFSIPSVYFASGLEESLARVVGVVFPNYQFLSTLVLVGGMFAIIGTLHSMIWSLSTLFTDVLEKSKSSVIKQAIASGAWNAKVSVIVTASIMLLTSLFIHAESILYSTICFLVIAYGLAITLLFFDRAAWKSGRNIITLISIFGCVVMFYYAILGVMS